MRRGGVVTIGTATALAVSAMVLLPARLSLAQTAACQAWSGEPSPLPSTSSKNLFEARWATLRASELERLARALEVQQPGLAQSLWTHVRCLDPKNATAEERQKALRPRIAFGTRPFVIRPKPTLVQQKRPADLEPVDRALAEAESELGEARFARAVEITEQTRRELEGRTDSDDLRVRRARLEVIAATALVALGRSEDASESAARALRADPELELDPNRTPPKIRRLFAQERERQGTARP